MQINCPPTTDVIIDGINIEEVDVSASGLTSIRRCNSITNEPIDLIISSDENHIGQGGNTDDGSLNIDIVAWVGPNGVIVPGAPLFPVSDCALCCDPWMASFSAADDLSEVQPFDVFSIMKPPCCVVTVTTPAGQLTIPNGITTYSPERFKCPLESISVTVAGECIPNEIFIFLQRTGEC